MQIDTDTSQIIFVEFKGSRRGKYMFEPSPEDEPIQRGEQVIISTREDGEENGVVTHVCPDCPNGGKPDYAEVRRLTPADYAHLIDNQEKEEEAWKVCQDRIDALHLDMKLTDIEFKFDRKKVTFYYTADQRVDFRQLVRDLAAVYRTRIEMRQIGVRDEAKRHGGVGVCGKRICCSAFIDDFEPVNTNLAKEQGLPLNPSKLTGLCGKLKCCLRFEHEYYEEKMEHFPDVGDMVHLPEGSAKVTSVDIFNDFVNFWVMDKAEMIEKPLSEVNRYRNKAEQV